MSCVSVTIRFLITRTSTKQSTIVGIPLGGLSTIFSRHQPPSPSLPPFEQVPCLVKPRASFIPSGEKLVMTQ
jgi:hypothetical protein